jgi:hypothetical protein
MSHANNITQKCQAAGQAMIVAAITGASITTIAAANVFSGIENGNVTGKRIVTECKRAQVESEGAYDGNWICDLIVRVIAPAADVSEDEFHALCGDIYKEFFQARALVEAALSNATIEFTAHHVYALSQEWDLLTENESNYWVSELLLAVNCCGSVIS